MNDDLSPDGTAPGVPERARTVKSGFYVKADLLGDPEQTAGLEPSGAGTLARPPGAPVPAAEALPGTEIGGTRWCASWAAARWAWCTKPRKPG